MNGEELKKWRRAKEWTQESLAQALGCSSAAVNRWEKGQEIPEPLQKLLRLLILGESPFSSPAPSTPELHDAAFTLQEWEQLDLLRARHNFGSVREYLVDVVRKHLKHESA